MRKSIPLTEAIRNRIKILEEGKTCVNGGGSEGLSWSQWELLKLEFADEVLAEIARGADRLARLQGVPRPDPVPVVDMRLVRKKTRA